jgi:argininosuccinate lyase
MKDKLWGGRFTKNTDKSVEEFTASISFDKRLFKYDIEGSIAHCKMLKKQGIIPQKEANKIIKGLKEIEKEIFEGRFSFKTDLEDIHMNIERRLIEKIGEIGGKLHTARSRNDQVALDIRMYLRDNIDEIIHLLKGLQISLIDLAEKKIDIVMPGYTHLQRAQPILFSHYLMGYFEMLARDRERLNDCRKRVNVMPLGAGALSGSALPIDRNYVAKLLKFTKITENSIDSVSDRDFIIEFCSNVSILMMHLSRLCEDFILFSSQEFAFIELPDSFCTGSSLMPQKKNPDVLELIRGKTGRVYGNLIALLTMMKSLPLAYNRDMQEDKEPLFDTIDTIKDALKIFTEIIPQIEVKKGSMLKAAQEGFLAATDLADYLVKKGVPFRSAHQMVGNIVKYCIKSGKDISVLSINEMREFSDLIGEDAFKAIGIKESVQGRDVPGGTAPKRVMEAIKRARKTLNV